MSEPDPQAATVLHLAKSGDVPAAIAAGEALLAGGSRDAALSLFVGMLCGRIGELERGLVHLRRSMDIVPTNPVARIELARMLLSAQHYEESLAIAEIEAGAPTPAGREMLRVKAHALRHLDRGDEARLAYETLTQADSGDFESWNGLGLACLALGNAEAAMAALQNATRLQPGSATYRIHLASACFVAENFPEAARAASDAVARDPSSAPARFELGRALGRLEQVSDALASLSIGQSLAAGDADMLIRIASTQADLKAFAVAEKAYRDILRMAPDRTLAWLGLAGLLERTNRMADLRDTLNAAGEAGVDPMATALLRARLLRSENKLEDALAAAQSAPVNEDPVGRSQLIGQIADRLGDTALAFSAFSDANAALAEREVAAQEKAEIYLRQLHALGDVLTPQWYAGWSKIEASGPRRAPLFIFGFPRSGTTLIDTMLIGHPDTVVLEEEPFIFRLAERLGPVERLPRLPHAETIELRRRYFAYVDTAVPDLGNRLIIDKNPLGIGDTLLLHRLFPEAKFIFVERHPFDVVLSGFITSARLNNNVATFSSLEGIARLYDEALRYWNLCCDTVPIATHRVRYERLIRDPEAELRPLAEFAGLAWDDRLLSHEANAAARDYIGSPSYAQVMQPLYSRASGRWRRYRQYFGRAGEILAPWVERMGYDLD